MPFSATSLEHAPLAVVIAAAGQGSRAGGALPKQWMPLADRPLIEYSFRFFDSMPLIGQITIALDRESLERPERLAFLKSSTDEKKIRFVPGASSRQESVWRALQSFDPPPEIVMIHDAARPFPPLRPVELTIAVARRRGGAILATPIVETVKRANKSQEIVETVDRQDLWAAQTPQTFLYAPLIEAYLAAMDDLSTYTDDAAIFQAAGGRVDIVAATRENFKLTDLEDFQHAERALMGKSHQFSPENQP